MERNGEYRSTPVASFVEASTYMPDYSDEVLIANLSQQNDNQLETYFPNETRSNDPSPKEGFADSFATYILDVKSDEEPDLLEGTTRGQVMDKYVRDKICKLLNGAS